MRRWLRTNQNPRCLFRPDLILPAAEFPPLQGLAKVPGVTGKDLSPKQLQRLRQGVGPRLRYIGKRCERMDRVGFVPNDPLRVAAQQAYDGMHALNVALIYAGGPHRQPITFNRPPRGSANGGGPDVPEPGKLPGWLRKQSGRESL